MEKFYSKFSGNLIHLIERCENLHPGRNRISPQKSYLCVSGNMGYKKGHSFGGAHKHLPQKRIIDKTQKTWVVIDGKVKIFMFDVDDSLIGERSISRGDCYIYFGEGGHSFEVLDENTFFYEIKNGPYSGRDKDKELI